jgi:hypothetical protein
MLFSMLPTIITSFSLSLSLSRSPSLALPLALPPLFSHRASCCVGLGWSLIGAERAHALREGELPRTHLEQAAVFASSKTDDPETRSLHTLLSNVDALSPLSLLLAENADSIHATARPEVVRSSFSTVVLPSASKLPHASVSSCLALAQLSLRRSKLQECRNWAARGLQLVQERTASYTVHRHTELRAALTLIIGVSHHHQGLRTQVCVGVMWVLAVMGIVVCMCGYVFVSVCELSECGVVCVCFFFDCLFVCVGVCDSVCLLP